MRLRPRLALIYSLAACVIIGTLALVINIATGHLLAQLATKNVAAYNTSIVSALQTQYDPTTKEFNLESTEALGMTYAHQGYLVTIHSLTGQEIWNARACDMEQCVAVIREIDTRMQQTSHTPGSFTGQTFPLQNNGETVGSVTIETYAPYFYSAAEAEFLSSLNTLLLGICVVSLAAMLVISILIAARISTPINRVVSATEVIAKGNFSQRISTKQSIGELRELSCAVNNLAESLEEGEHYLKRLNSDLAHELRTPLTTLQGDIEAMLDGVWEPTPARLESCHQEIVRLTALTEDLAQISLIERENLGLSVTEFDLAEAMREAASRFKADFAAKELHLILQLQPVMLQADRTKIMQLDINLLANALRYTEKGSATVEVASQNDMAILRVSDTGIGISSDDLPHIFERFYRADSSRSRHTGGTGIGLAIAKAIVEAHHGTIQATSTLTKGTEISVSLPQHGLNCPASDNRLNSAH